MTKGQIGYIFGNEDLLDMIEPLWKELNEHHKLRSPYFKEEYEIFTFEQRKSLFQEKAAEGMLRVELAEDLTNNKRVAYCISSVNKHRQGEIDSIIVMADYRGLGIGDYLTQKALVWMDEQKVRVKTVHVAAGNEAAFSFYARYGFLPRQTILKQRD